VLLPCSWNSLRHGVIGDDVSHESSFVATV
jgi:hypothetical protein